jgi:glyoxylase-like metal-dependent hydrolase (beta-lactamase superfamily II)
MAAQDIRRWKVGSVMITRIVKTAPIKSPMSLMCPGDTPALRQPRAGLSPYLSLHDGERRLSWHCFVVETPSHRIMVDACMGHDRQWHFDSFRGMQGDFLQDLESAGYPLAAIDTVMCPHLHCDHVGWSTHLVNGRWMPTFRNARYLFNHIEWAHVQRLHAAGDWHGKRLPDAAQPIVDAGLADFIHPGHRIGNEVSLVPTPGHTPGHVSVRIESHSEQAVITGDMLHHPVQSALPHKPCGFDAGAKAGQPTRVGFPSRVQNSTACHRQPPPQPTTGSFACEGPHWRFKTDRPAD